VTGVYLGGWWWWWREGARSYLATVAGMAVDVQWREQGHELLLVAAPENTAVGQLGSVALSM